MSETAEEALKTYLQIVDEMDESESVRAKALLRVADVCYDDYEDPRLFLNMNDTFGWATAWGESVPEDQLELVARLFRDYGRAGLYYWVSERNNRIRSEFEDINRFIDFVREEERIIEKEPDWNRRAYLKASYVLPVKP